MNSLDNVDVLIFVRLNVTEYKFDNKINVYGFELDWGQSYIDLSGHSQMTIWLMTTPKNIMMSCYSMYLKFNKTLLEKSLLKVTENIQWPDECPVIAFVLSFIVLGRINFSYRIDCSIAAVAVAVACACFGWVLFCLWKEISVFVKRISEYMWCQLRKTKIFAKYRYSDTFVVIPTSKLQ